MSLTVVDLAAEHRGAGPFVATPTPRLSWRVATSTPGWYQASYEIEISGDLEYRGGPVASERLGAGAVAGGAAGVAPERDLPGAGHRRRRGGQRLERAAGDPCTAAGRRRLVGAVHLARRRGCGDRSRSPAPTSGASSPWRSRGGARVLSVTALGVYQVQINGHRVGDEELAPGWTSYRHRLRFRQPRRHRVAARRRQRHRRHRRRRLGARAPRVQRCAQLLHRPAGVAGAARHHPCGRPPWPSRHRPHRRHGRRVALRRRAGARLRPVRRRDLRCAARVGRLVAAWLTTTGGWQPAEVIEHDLATLTPAAVPPVRAVQEVAPVSICTRPLRRDAGRLRPEPGGPGAHSVGDGAGRGRDRGHCGAGHRGAGGHGSDRAPRRGAGERRVGRAPAALRPGHRPLHSARRRARGVGAAFHVPRLPLRRRQRLARRVAARRHHCRGVAFRPGAHRLVRVLGCAGQPAP